MHDSDISLARITEHARWQFARRGILVAEVQAVLENPDTVSLVREGRVVAQAVRAGYLLRVFVDIDRAPPEVVTAYRTSKLRKYGRA